MRHIALFDDFPLCTKSFNNLFRLMNKLFVVCTEIFENSKSFVYLKERLKESLSPTIWFEVARKVFLVKRNFR